MGWFRVGFTAGVVVLGLVSGGLKGWSRLAWGYFGVYGGWFSVGSGLVYASSRAGLGLVLRLVWWFWGWLQVG